MLLVARIEAPELEVPGALAPGRLLEVAPFAIVELLPVLLFVAFPFRKSGGFSLGLQPDSSMPTPTIATQDLIAGHRRSRVMEQATKVGKASRLTESPCVD